MPSSKSYQKFPAEGHVAIHRLYSVIAKPMEIRHFKEREMLFLLKIIVPTPKELKYLLRK